MNAVFDLNAIQASFAKHRNGRYRVVRQVGQGGMGSVFLGRDSGFRDCWCAIKIIHPQLLEHQQLLQRFLNEARIMARLRHANLVEIYEQEDLEGLPFIVLEWIDGGSLSQWVERNGVCSPRMAADVNIRVCEGVAAAHQLGVVHRDLKPDNIMLVRETGIPKVTDFGIARMDTGQGHLTATGVGVGTPSFMAPEQFSNARGVDHRADIYSLGLVLWSLMKGEFPPQMFFLLPETDPSQFDGIPPELTQVIVRASQMRPEDRYQSVGELREALLSIRDSLPAQMSSQTMPYGGVGDPMAPIGYSTLATPGAVQLPVPTHPSMLIGLTLEAFPTVQGTVRPDLQAIAARLASPPPSPSSKVSESSSVVSAPPSVDTLGGVAVEMSATQYRLRLAEASRTGRWRSAGILSALVVGGLLAWFWRTTSTTEPTLTPPTSVATAPAVTPTPKSTPAPATAGVSPTPSPSPSSIDPLASASPLPRREAEVKTHSPAAPTVEPIPTAYPPLAETSPKAMEKKPKPAKDKEPKPGKTKKPRDAKTALAKAPEVPAPVAETTRVGLTFPDGEPVKVWLMGPTGRHNLPASVPPGTYKVMVRWPNDDQDRTAIGTLNVGAAGVTISCKTPTLKCRSH